VNAFNSQKKYREELTRVIHSCKLGTAKWMLGGGGDFKIPLADFSNRPVGKKISRANILRVCLQYAPVHRFLNPGNQLSTWDEKLIRSGDFDIEIFGSAFNTRLPQLHVSGD